MVCVAVAKRPLCRRLDLSSWTLSDVGALVGTKFVPGFESGLSCATLLSLATRLPAVGGLGGHAALLMTADGNDGAQPCCHAAASLPAYVPALATW